MSGPDDLQRAAERVQDLLWERYRGEPWLQAIGIASRRDGYAVQLRIDPQAQVRREDFPSEIDGIPIEVEFLRYSAEGDD